MKKRILAAILLCLLLIPSFASCNQESTGNENSTGGETGTADADSSADAENPISDESSETTSNVDARNQISDDLPETTYNGASFRVLTTEGGAIYGFDYRDEIVSEELTGDSCNDAVYNRNLGIESRFDVKISCANNTKPQNYVATMAASGIDEYEIVGMYNFEAYTAINSEAVLNWTTVPHVNLEKPWHNQLANDAATMNNTLYAICSDLAITSMLYTHAFFFNQTITEKYGYPADSLYALVKDGQWTLDKAIEITSGIYEDLNGDGVQDENDLYGFAYSVWNAADVWLSAFDQPICKTSDDGVELTFMTDKTVAIVEKLCDWHYNKNCFYNYTAIYHEEVAMKNGKLAFAPIRFKACFDALRDMDDSYGIIPYPKWDEEQEQYLTNADDKFTVFTVPITAAGNTDFVGVIYEALCAESYKSVYPIYYDAALKGKYSSDPTTAEMIDLIMSGRNFDFAFQFANDCFQGIPYWVREALQSNDTNVASRYASIKKALNKSISKKLSPLYGLES